MTEEQQRRRRRRNWMILGLIVLFVLMIYLVSIVQIGRFWDLG